MCPSFVVHDISLDSVITMGHTFFLESTLSFNPRQISSLNLLWVMLTGFLED